jgi:hypothetical protein
MTISSLPSFHGNAATSRPDRGAQLRRALLGCGIASSVVYIAANVIASLVWPSYSSTSQTISELSAIDAPSRSTWLPLGLAYDVLLIGFGIGVWQCARTRSLKITSAMLIAIGVLGTFWPPMHLRGSVATLTDTLHIAFAGVTSLLILLAVGFGAAAMGPRFRAYSIATIAVLLVSGVLTSFQAPGVAANAPTPWIGVYERIDVAAYLLWIAVLAVAIVRSRRYE